MNWMVATVVRRVAVLIASKNGASTIAGAVAAVVREGSTSSSCPTGRPPTPLAVAIAAGATMLDLDVNVGKPAALHRLYRDLHISSRYDVVAILDDDVIVEPNFLHEALLTMTPDVAIAVGPQSHRLARRASVERIGGVTPQIRPLIRLGSPG